MKLPDKKASLILRWEELASFAGDEINRHRQFFKGPKDKHDYQTTYGLLCCPSVPKHERRTQSREGVHAEQRLLNSPMWTDEIPQALQNWSELSTTRIFVVMAINRSPCRICTKDLVKAMRALEKRYPKRFEEACFILACKGAYLGRVDKEAGYYADATTDLDLRHLAEAGWNLCVLQVGDSLTPSGKELLQGLKRMYGTQ